MPDKLRVFTGPSAFPNPQRLRLFALEKGIQDRLEEVVYAMTPGGDQRKWPHLKMNPWGETPTLEAGEGVYLSETPAVARYLDQTFPGRKLMGETALDQAEDNMWDQRVWIHVLYNIVTMFHVMHQGLGFKLEPTYNPSWGERCRKEAFSNAALVDRHLSDGREWLLGGDEPTFADTTLCVTIAFSKFPTNNTPLDERFEFLDGYWNRWKERDSFKLGYADGQSGLEELDHLQSPQRT